MIKQESLRWSKIDSFVGNFTDPSLLMYRPCPICGSLEQKTLLVFDNFQFFSDSDSQPKRVNIKEVQCLSCYGIFLNPGYSNFGFDILFAEAGMSYGSTEGRPLEQVEWLKKHKLLKSGNTILDIGCYEGRFLSVLPSDMKRIGIDIDSSAIERGDSQFSKDGIELIHGRFENFNCPHKPDVITMFHVLEHLSDPFTVLTHLRDVSGVDTKLLVEVPVLEHGKTNDINGFFSVQHMTHFSMISIRELLARSGWAVDEREQMNGYNGHRVVAVPDQKDIVIKGNVNDIAEVYGYLKNWYESLQGVTNIIDSLPLSSKIVVWGAGLHTEFLYQVSLLFQKNMDCKYIVVDSDDTKQGKSWRGIPIYSPQVLETFDWNDCHMIVSSYGGMESIARAAAAMQVPDVAICKLYDTTRVY